MVISVERFLRLAKGLKYYSKGVMKLGDAGFTCNCPADQLDGNIVTACLISQSAQQMQYIGILRLVLQELEVVLKFLSFLISNHLAFLSLQILMLLKMVIM